MRIISGKFKGRKLISPNNNLIRPTTDRAKEMIFNTLSTIIINEKYNLEKFQVLDAFCGSGALGIEALSRGVKTVTFIDNSNESLNLCKQNCKQFSLLIHSNFLKIDLIKKQKIKKKFDLFFADPPYEKKILNKFLILMYEKEWLKKNSIGVVEIRKNEDIEDFNFIKLIKRKNLGISSFLFIRII